MAKREIVLEVIFETFGIKYSTRIVVSEVVVRNMLSDDGWLKSKALECIYLQAKTQKGGILEQLGYRKSNTHTVWLDSKNTTIKIIGKSKHTKKKSSTLQQLFPT